MQIRESLLIARESRGLRSGHAGWRDLANDCLAGTPLPHLEVPERWTGAAMDQSASASD